MPVITILAFVDIETSARAVLVLGDASGKLGFFLGSVDDFVGVADPATLGGISLTLV